MNDLELMKKKNLAQLQKLGIGKKKGVMTRVGQTKKGMKYRDYYINKEQTISNLYEYHRDYFEVITGITFFEISKCPIMYKNLCLNKEGELTYERILKNVKKKVAYGFSDYGDNPHPTDSNQDRFIEKISKSFPKLFLKKILNTHRIIIKLYITNWDFNISFITNDWFHTGECERNKSCESIIPVNDGIKLVKDIFSKSRNITFHNKNKKQNEITPIQIKVLNNKQTLEDLIYDKLKEIEIEYQMLPFYYHFDLCIEPKPNPFW